MSEQLKAAYTNYRWVKTAAFTGLIACGVLLCWLSGGFPPWAWRFLFQVLPQIPQLWQAQGGAILAPLVGLVLLSSALLIMWIALAISVIKVGLHWWHDFHEQQHFQMDVYEAERMANDVTISDLDEEELFTSRVGGDASSARSSVPLVGVGGTSRGSRPARGPQGVRLREEEDDDVDALPTRPVERQQSPQRALDRSPATRQPMRVNAPLLEPRYFTNEPTEREEQVQAPQERVQTSLRAASPSYPMPLAPRDDQRRVQTSSRAASPVYQAQQALDLPPRRATQSPKTERRVHIPPSASTSMRDQLRIVSPPAEERLYGDYDTLPGVSTLDEEVESEELQQNMSQLLEEVESEELQQDVAPLVPEEAESEELAQGDEQPQSPGRPQGIAPTISREQQATPAGIVGAIPCGRPERDQQLSVELLRQVSPAPTGSAQRLVVGVGLDPGIVRRKAPNEDSLFAIQGTRITEHGTEPVGLFVVADGMGGHAHGREASRMAIQSISDLVVPVLMRNTDSSQEESFADLLKDGVHRANLAIYQRNRQQEHMMGTTLTGALIVESTAYIANVGDSRTYLYRKSEGLSPLTRDHSIVARMVEDGIITVDDIYTHPKRNQIYRCLGERASVEVDTFVVPLRAGDILLLCSDGLWEMVRDEDMRKIIASSVAHPSQISSMLVQAALSRGGADNVSVVVVYVAVA
ncbi:MAG TPA: protein phosphatase 2C domain-containing protein [Ktedonosporobacter sp.]|nr:protein phosphatase 2C domain-containing protein [Ktedonosporobacter sp.]